MTDTRHPLDPLTADEFGRVRAALVAAGLVGDTTRFPCVLPVEPAKDAVRAHRPGVAVRGTGPAGPGRAGAPAPVLRPARRRGGGRGEHGRGGRLRRPADRADNPRGNAFTTRGTVLERESVAARTADTARGRTWVVRSAESRNRLGKPRAYQLVPSPGPTLLAQEGSSVAGRAAFATRHLWVTRFAEDERFPAGDHPNQHPGGAGLPAWTARDRDLVDTDVVLWHVFGPTHLPRPEDWPVMPVDRSGFRLRPLGFCDRNPALDLPDLAACAHCPPGACECEH
ncbi:hypothetical protein A6A25_07520 [Saccharothrix sp. CB00851]|nr:hypothetical protein A6A25_07520 [Saccharothrix sp. CB00851]